MGTHVRLGLISIALGEPPIHNPVAPSYGVEKADRAGWLRRQGGGREGTPGRGIN